MLYRRCRSPSSHGVPSTDHSPCPPAAIRCLPQRRGVFVHPLGSGRSRTAMADGHSQATKAKTNPRIRHDTKNPREFNWSVTIHSHNLVTLLVHKNPLARASCGTVLGCQHHLLKHSRFATSPSHPSLAVRAEENSTEHPCQGTAAM